MSDTLELHNDKFQLRWYQEPLWDAIFEKDYKRLIACLPRRAGKDITLWNMAIHQCIIKRCMVAYVLPSYKQAKQCIWSAIAIDGTKFLDFIPSILIESTNVSDLEITFINGSKLKLVGGESHDRSLRGSNPYAVILSEFAYLEDAMEVLDTVSPILAANEGWLAIASTPYGKNTYWHLMQMAKQMPDSWFVVEKKTSDINHISHEALEEERARMSPEKFAQEYECSFERGITGSIFGRELDRLKQAGQVTSVSWEPGLVTYCAIDIGVRDATTILWFQVVGDGTIIRIIDSYSNTGHGLDHYSKIIKEKPYTYHTDASCIVAYAPHDIKVREWGGGALTRYEKAKQLGIHFTVLDQIPKADSIENALTHFPKMWIDANKCKSLIDALENYYKEWDEEKQVYSDKPVHNWASNYADAFMYMCQAIYKTRRNKGGEEYDTMRNKALYGNRLHKIFQHNPMYDR
jgi:phage terminase large subunit